MKFEKETGIYKGRFSASELGGSTYTFEQVTGLYIKGERELFASQWTQEEIRIAEVRVLTIEEKPEERTSQEKHLQEEGMPREQMQQRGIQREQMQQGGIAREQMQGEPSQGTDFQEKHQQQREVPEEYQQKQQATEAQPETLQTESLQRQTKTGKTKERTDRKARHCGRQKQDRSMTGVMNGKNMVKVPEMSWYWLSSLDQK